MLTVSLDCAFGHSKLAARLRMVHLWLVGMFTIASFNSSVEYLDGRPLLLGGWPGGL
jgi:hypothetical protein